MESFAKFVESIQWYDEEKNSVEPDNAAFAVLSDGSVVTFEQKYDYIKVVYEKIGSETSLAIRTFADAHPEEKLDGRDLNKFLPNYRETKPGIYQRFELKPGMTMGDGDTYHPETQPDLSDYMLSKVLSRYPNGNTFGINLSTGYVLADGRTVPMGRGGPRDDDHRFINPDDKTLERWGWGKLDSETQKMNEMIKRSGAARVIVSDPFYIHTAKPLTKSQKRVIREYIEKNRIKEVVISFIDGKEYEFDSKDHRKMDRYL